MFSERARAPTGQCSSLALSSRRGTATLMGATTCRPAVSLNFYPFAFSDFWLKVYSMLRLIMAMTLNFPRQFRARRSQFLRHSLNGFNRRQILLQLHQRRQHVTEVGDNIFPVDRGKAARLIRTGRAYRQLRYAFRHASRKQSFHGVRPGPPCTSAVSGKW